MPYKRPVYTFAFDEYNSKQVNVNGIKIYRAQFQSLKLRNEVLNAANIYLSGIILTNAYIYTGLLIPLWKLPSPIAFKRKMRKKKFFSKHKIIPTRKKPFSFEEEKSCPHTLWIRLQCRTIFHYCFFSVKAVKEEK